VRQYVFGAAALWMIMVGSGTPLHCSGWMLLSSIVTQAL
jgi:hypothetical protein